MAVTGPNTGFMINSNITQSLWGCGYNSAGQLGALTITNYSSMVQISSNNSWSYITSSSYDTFAIKNGELWAIGGYNGNFTLGFRPVSHPYLSSPVQIGSLTNWSTVISTPFTTFALKTDGTAWAWGNNQYGYLGTGDTIAVSSPVQIATDSTFKAIGSVNYNPILQKTDNSLWTCGYGASGGYLGTGSTTNVSSLVQIGSASDWVGATLVNSNRIFNPYVIKGDGSLWGWGRNNRGSLGLQTVSGPAVDSSSPTQVGILTGWQNVTANSSNYIIAPSTASGSLYQIKQNGTLWVSGMNDTFQLGLGDNIDRSSPTQVGSLTNWKMVSSSGYKFIYGTSLAAGVGCALAVKTDGTLWGWGANLNGNLGVGDVITRSSPVQVGLAANWKQVSVSTGYISARTFYTMAVKTDGTLWGWGENSKGQLGINSILSVSTPAQIGTDTNWKVVSTSQITDAGYSIALRTDGTLWGFGSGYNGVLGIGGTGPARSSPVQIGSSSDWDSVYASGSVVYGIKTDNTLWTWGSCSSFVSLNANALNPVSGFFSSPVQITATADWRSVAHDGVYNGVGIKTDGTLWIWGYNLKLFGLGSSYSSTQTSSPVQIGSSSNWATIELHTHGHSSICTFLAATKTDGTLWTWGINTPGGDPSNYTDYNNSYGGGLGYTLTGNALITYFSPVQITSTYDWAQIAPRDRAVVGLKKDGTIWGWGYNSNGILGFVSPIANNDVSSPTQIGSSSDWSSISSFYAGTMAIKKNGTLWGWGDNSYGTLSRPAVNPATATAYWSYPVQIGTEIDTWSLIGSSGYYNFLGIRKYNTGSDLGQRYISKDYLIDAYPSIATNAGAVTPGLWVSGGGAQGELGINDTVNVYSSFVQVSGNTWNKLSDGGGYNFTWAIRNDGTLWGWGSNINGQVGDGTGVSRASPVQIGTENYWNKVSGGTGNSFAIRNDGTAWGVGYNGYGNLGITPSFTPDYRVSSPVQFGVGNTWKQITAGATASTLAIRSDNTLWVAGYNENGMLGINQNPGIGINSPKQVGSLSDWKQVSCGLGGLTMAVKTDGTLWGMGASSSGALGLVYATDHFGESSPVQIGSLTNWANTYATSTNLPSAINTGSPVFQIKQNGTLWSWGPIVSGYYSSPVQIGSNTDWKFVASSAQCAAAIKTDNTLWTWGSNANGQLGLPDITITSSSPAQIGALTWSKVAASQYFMVGIRSNGALYGWGDNRKGQLGLIDTVSRSSPTQIGTSTNWASVACGYNCMFAINTSGQLFACGYNPYTGDLGLGFTSGNSTSSLMQIGTNTNWAMVSARTGAPGTVSALKTDGTIWGWGYNYKGRISATNLFNLFNSPVQIGSGTTWQYVSSGQNVTFALRNDHTLHGAGDNSLGQINSNLSITGFSVMTQVGGVTESWATVSVSETSVIAAHADGTLWGWGGSDQGSIPYLMTRLGLYNVSSPVQIGSGNDWKSVTVHPYGGWSAIKNNGTLWSAGYNGYGNLGNGTLNNLSSPTQIGSLTNWKQVYTSRNGNYPYALATKTDGTLWALGGMNINGCWGDAIGHDTFISSPVQLSALTTWKNVCALNNAALYIKDGYV